MTFTTTSDNVMLAWGGHISTSPDWDGDPTAVTIPGSPYHMRVLASSGGGGNQDRSLSASAILTADPTITINKVLVDGVGADAGLFNLEIDGATAGGASDVGNGGTSGAVTVPAGTYTIGESAGTGTNLANYMTVISGACAADGTVTVAADENVVCTITNTRLTRTLRLAKSLSPTNDPGTFDLRLDTNVFIVDEAINGSFGDTTVNVDVDGSVTVDEISGDVGALANYTSSLSCAGTNVVDPGGTTTGDLTIPAGAGDITCTFTNTLITAGITLIKGCQSQQWRRLRARHRRPGRGRCKRSECGRRWVHQCSERRPGRLQPQRIRWDGRTGGLYDHVELYRGRLESHL